MEAVELIEEGGGLFAFLGLVVAVVGILVAVWVTRRYGTRRGQLVIDVYRARVIDRSVRGLVQISVNGQPLRRPMLMTVDLLNPGPRDVASQSFDQGRPITVTLPERTVCVTLMPPVGLDEVQVKLSESAVMIGPALIKRGARASVQVLCDGDHRDPVPPEVDAPLVDVDPDIRLDEQVRPVLLGSTFARVRDIFRSGPPGANAR